MKNIMKETENLGKVFDYCSTANKKKEIKINFMGYKVSMETIRYEKKGSKWVETEREEKQITEENYENVINSKHFFTNLGGYERHSKSYTYIGYIVTTVNSISPDRQNKTVRHFTVTR
jgi:hypothetical protein